MPHALLRSPLWSVVRAWREAGEKKGKGGPIPGKKKKNVSSSEGSEEKKWTLLHKANRAGEKKKGGDRGDRNDQPFPSHRLRRKEK